MALFGQKGDAKAEDVNALLAKKNYARAIEVIKAQLSSGRPDPRLRLQLGDVLALAGKNKEAVNILLPLADEFAKEGFAAKAISVLKKVQKLDPGRRDVDTRLASLIQEKQKFATAPAAPPPPSFELGMEELSLDIGGPPISVPVAEPRRPEPEPVRAAPAPAPAPPQPRPAPAPPPAAPPAARPQPAPAPPAPRPAPAPAPPKPAPPPAVVDQDLLEFEGLDQIEPEPEVMLEPEPEGASGEPPMSEGLFADELANLVEDVFSNLSFGGDSGQSGEAPPDEQGGGAQIVVSPLFRDFSVEELVAVIQGLNLLTFERGQVIIREGEPGNSLYMLTSGTVKAFKKDPNTGKQVPIRELEEGAFFGEGSILTGNPRSATIVATAHCELLELDRPTLDGITKTHPRVWDVLREFAAQRK